MLFLMSPEVVAQELVPDLPGYFSHPAGDVVREKPEYFPAFTAIATSLCTDF
ncbi:hypothetical protein [Streptomyces californicus]|uniref:hypothetical protein n=1 Tax=Streptomyces californicus TaxID=67351 RepID=UPI00296EA698|nr:hypothetical protein [Streptomyces californicus]MDW4917689.1 hypothetical protein [Streptomyces californicus]